MLKRHKKHQQLQQQKSTKYNQTMRNLNTILSQHQEQYQACKEYSKMFVECMYIHMNEWCEGVCPPENHHDGEEIRWYLPWSYSPFHSKTAAKHIPRASGSRKVKLGSKNSHGVNDARSFSGDHSHLARKYQRKSPKNRSCMKIVNSFRGKTVNVLCGRQV